MSYFQVKSCRRWRQGPTRAGGFGLCESSCPETCSNCLQVVIALLTILYVPLWRGSGVCKNRPWGSLVFVAFATISDFLVLRTVATSPSSNVANIHLLGKDARSNNTKFQNQKVLIPENNSPNQQFETAPAFCRCSWCRRRGLAQGPRRL